MDVEYPFRCAGPCCCDNIGGSLYFFFFNFYFGDLYIAVSSSLHFPMLTVQFMYCGAFHPDLNFGSPIHGTGFGVLEMASVPSSS